MDEVARATAVRESSVKAEVGWRAGAAALRVRLTVHFSSLMTSSRSWRRTSHPSLWYGWMSFCEDFKCITRIQVADLMTSFLYPEVSRMAVASSVAEVCRS